MTDILFSFGLFGVKNTFTTTPPTCITVKHNCANNFGEIICITEHFHSFYQQWHLLNYFLSKIFILFINVHLMTVFQIMFLIYFFLTFNLTRITDHCVIRSSNLINCSLCLWCWNICDSYRFHFLTRISIPVGHEICVCISKVSIINNPMK